MNMRTSLRDVYFAGFIMAILYYATSLIVQDPLVEAALWFFGVFWSFLIFKRGADYRRILNSFSLSFVVIIGYIYMFFIIVLGIGGIPRAMAFFLLPLVIIAFLGYVKDKYLVMKASRARIQVKVSIKKRVRITLFKLDPLLIAFIIIGFSILIFFLLTPVLIMLANAFVPPVGKPFYYNFYRIFTNREYVRLNIPPFETAWKFMHFGNRTVLVITGINYGILVNSLINAVVVTATATVLGILVAFVLARYNFPGKTFFRVFALVPLFITPFINSYVIKIMFSEYGPISMITESLFGFDIRIDKLAGVALAQIMAFYPIVYLNAFSSFINIDPSMEEQAENLGARGLKLFFTVTLPLALPGVVAGSILVFIFSLEDLGAPIVFQESRLMSYQIYSSFTSETGIVSPEIAALGFVMLFLAVMGFLAIRSYVGMRSYAMISRGGIWKPRERRLGIKGLLAVYLVLLPLIFFTALPQIGVVLLAFNIMPPRGFEINLGEASPKYFVELFTNPDIFMYIRNTLTYAIVAVAVATVIAIIIAYSVSRTRIRFLTPAMDTLATIPLAIPGLVIALGYYYFYSSVFHGTPLDPTQGPTVFQAWIVLIIAYSIRKLPFVVRSVYAGFQQVHEALEEAALNLGATRARVIFGVVLPLVVAYIISGAIVGFIYISTEVSTSVTIGGLRPDQAPMTFFMMNVYKGGTVTGVQYVAAMGVLLIMFQLVAVLMITVVFKQRYAFIGV